MPKWTDYTIKTDPADNDEVINCPANELPENFPANL